MSTITPLQTPPTPMVDDEASKKRSRSPSLKSESEATPSPQKLPANMTEFFKRKRCLVTISFNDDHRMPNSAFLSSKCYTTIFGENAQNGKYLAISNFVFRAFRDYQLHEKPELVVNQVTYHQVKSAILEESQKKRLWIRGFDLKGTNLATLQEICLRLYPRNTMNVFGNSSQKCILSKNSVQDMIKKKFKGEILKLKQQFLLFQPGVGALTAVLERWDQKKQVDAKDNIFADESLPMYGMINENTVIRVFTGNQKRLAFVNEIDPEKVEVVQFEISRVDEIFRTVLSGNSTERQWVNGVQSPPLLLPFSEACKIKQECLGKLLIPGHQVKLKVKNYLCTMTLKAIRVTQPMLSQAMELNYDQDEQEYAIRLRKEHQIKLLPGNNYILTNSPDCYRIATSLTFEITDIARRSDLKKNEVPWVNIQEIREVITKQDLLLADGCNIRVIINMINYQLKLIQVSGGPANKGERSDLNLEPNWKVSKDTTIKLIGRNDFEIVDTPKASELESLEVNVTVSSLKKKDILKELFDDLDSSEDADGQNSFTSIDETELEELFRDSLPSNGLLHKKRKIEGISRRGEKICFTFQALNPKQSEQQEEPSYYGNIFKVTPNTKVTFETKVDSHLLIPPKPKEITPENLDEKLLELGIGGIPEELKKAIFQIIISRITYAKHTARLGLQPTRGLLLWGPPGTGKTLLARKLGELLGVTQERAHMITGSDIPSKWTGEAEKNVRTLFDKARKEQERYGDKSPLHLLVIDEAEVLLGERSKNAKSWETGPTNAFLSALDGISQNGTNSLNNIIVIGITNNPEQLDPACTRPGRLETKIYIGLPDRAGREEIFNIHTKIFREQGLLADDIDVSKIVEMTLGKSGADIASLITVAHGYTLRRMIKNKVPEDQIKEHLDAKLTMADFIDAYDERTETKQTTLFVPNPTISKDAIIDDLTKLGLAGFNEEVIQFLYDLKVSQRYQLYQRSMGMTFPKSVVFYGPSGSGKTSLVKNLEHLCGLSGERFKYITTSELFSDNERSLQSRQTGKEKIKAIIEPAQAACKDFGETAPLHIVIVDELDKGSEGLLSSIFGKGDNNESSIKKSLSNLKALFGDFSDIPSQLLIIGIVKSDFSYSDESVVENNSSNSDTIKFVPIQYPNSEGKKAICNIYLEKGRQEGCLDERVTCDGLIKIIEHNSQTYTGRDIKELFNQAKRHVLQRVALAGIDPLKVAEDDRSKMTIEDFKKAHDNMRPSSSASSAPHHMMYL